MATNMATKIVKLLIILLFSLHTVGCYAKPKVACVAPDKLPQHISSLGIKPTSHMILVDAKKQKMSVIHNGKIEKEYTISTSHRGLGQYVNTFQTPVGLHRINEKIGKGVPRYGIFNRRQFIGSAWKPRPRDKHRKDYISTRILRLEGLQPGLNKGQDFWGRTVDTETRAVYIHGTTMEWKLGRPSTKGCVHMSADDVIHLFEEVPEGTLVWIQG